MPEAKETYVAAHNIPKQYWDGEQWRDSPYTKKDVLAGDSIALSAAHAAELDNAGYLTRGEDRKPILASKADAKS